MRPDAPRPEVIGPDAGPEAPFPLHMAGTVVSGFGRGSKELGIPTANIPVDSAPWIEKAESGVYFGWASLQLPEGHPSLNSSPSTPSGPSTTFTESSSLTQPVSHVKFPQTALDRRWRLYPMVMSIGYNPFYKNTVRSAEVHVMHRFEKDFYGSEMRLKLLGYIRPEYDYVDVEALVGDIKTDIEVTGRSLGRKAWGEQARDPWLAVCESGHGWCDDVEKGAEEEESKSAWG